MWCWRFWRWGAGGGGGGGGVRTFWLRCRWFAWANSLFAELVIQLAIERPHLVFQASD
jgi:hypothetical protein